MPITYTQLADVIIQYSSTIDPPPRKYHKSPSLLTIETCQGHEPYVDASPLTILVDSSNSDIPHVAIKWNSFIAMYEKKQLL